MSITFSQRDFCGIISVENTVHSALRRNPLRTTHWEATRSETSHKYSHYIDEYRDKKRQNTNQATMAWMSQIISTLRLSTSLLLFSVC